MRISSLRNSVEAIDEMVNTVQDADAIGIRHETSAVKHITSSIGKSSQPRLNDKHAEVGKRIPSTIVRGNVDRNGAETGAHILKHQKSLGITPHTVSHEGALGKHGDIVVKGKHDDGTERTTSYSLKRGGNKKTKLPQASTINRQNDIFGTKSTKDDDQETRMGHIHHVLSNASQSKLHHILGKVNETSDAHYEVKNQSKLRDRTEKSGKVSITDVNARFHPSNIKHIEYSGRVGKYSGHLHVHTNDGTHHRISIFAHKSGKTQFEHAEV